jgi:hypothetical protein
MGFGEIFPKFEHFLNVFSCFVSSIFLYHNISLDFIELILSKKFEMKEVLVKSSLLYPSA